MARKRKRHVPTLAAQVKALTERVNSMSERLHGIDTNAQVLAEAITREIRNVVESEVDDVLN